MVTTKIKHCPFCGSEPFIDTSLRYPRSGKYSKTGAEAYKVMCGNIECVMYKADNKMYNFGVDAAIKAWNRRV